MDLYLNGEYAGNYYVTEKVEVHKNPLPITDMEKVAELTNNNEEFNVYETAWTDSTKAKDAPKDPVDITGGYFLLPERYQSLFGDDGFADPSAACGDDRRVRGYGQGSVVGTVCGKQYMGEP